RAPPGAGLARGLGARRLRAGSRRVEAGRLLPAHRAARRAPGRRAGPQHRGDAGRQAAAAVPLQDPRAARHHRAAHGGGRDPRLPLLRNPRLVALAGHLHRKASWLPEEGPRLDRLDARSLLLEGHRPAADVALTNHLGAGCPPDRCGEPRSQRVTPTEASIMSPDLDLLCINTIRTLSIDAVQAASSGHPGTPMALAPLVYTLWNRVLRFDPQDPISPAPH